MSIFASTSFQAAFASSASYATFAKEFRAWKIASDPCAFAMFGRDVQTQIKIGHDFDKLMHTHLEPLKTEAVFKIWQKAFQSRTTHQRCDRTSNRLLYYVTFDSHFLLLLYNAKHPVPSPAALEPLCFEADRLIKQIKTKLPAQKTPLNP